MNTRTSRVPKRIAASAAAAAMVGSVLALSGTPALADHVPATTYGGSDRYETATLVADAIDSVATVTVANGLNFPDGLAGAFLEDAILLTEADTLHPTTEAWLVANNAEVTNIQIVGGEAVVSAAVAAELATYGTVTRLSGPTRYDTAVAIAEAQSPGATEIIVADGLDFPDALASGPLAIEADAPIILNDGATLRPEVAAYLAANPQIDDAYIVGGNAAVPTTVEVQLTGLGITVERLSGPTRDETAVAIANELQELTGGYDTGAIIANRLRFADAMVAGPLGAQEDYPILLVSETALPIATEDYLVDNCATIGTIVAVGGEAVINASTSEAARQAATCDAVSNQTFTVTPAGDQTGQAGSVQQFSFTGITPGSLVDIQLVDCSNVATDASGVTTFSGTNPGGTGNVAQNDDTNTAQVTVVNGVATTTTDGVLVPSSGTVTFSIDTTGGAGECFVAVVFNDADNDGRIDLNADGTPSEVFGTSGDITVIAVEAADNSAVTGPVAFVDTANDVFSNASFSFFYDSNDEFILAGSPNTALTLAEFEARLSVGDGISGTYRSNPANQSSFILDDSAPLPPTITALRDPALAANAGRGGIEVVFTDSGTDTVASYNVLRTQAVVSTVIGVGPQCPDAQTAAGAAAYSPIGTVADTAAGSTANQYVYYDGTAMAPAAGQTTPQYCYVVQAVDASGDAGRLSDEAGPATAAAASTASSMAFTAAGSGVVSDTTIRVRYNNVVNPATVAANGSDFRVTSTTGTVSTALVVTAASVGTPNTDVVLTVASGASTGTITVTSQTGTDTNTVCAGTTTTNCQPAGQTVVVGSDIVAPVASSAAVTGTALTLTYNEALDAASVPATTAYTVSGTTVTGVAISGSTVVLTLGAAPANGATVTVNYVVPGANMVQDVPGNDAAALTGFAVTNNN